MNKKIYLSSAIISLIFLSSCLTSLHNLVSYTTVTTDNRITGNWQYMDMQVKVESIPESRFFTDMVTSTVNKEEKKSGYDSKEDSLLYSKSYVISFIKNDYRYDMLCCLTRLGNELYADLQPATATPVSKPDAKNSNDLFSSGNYISSHSIAKIIFYGNDIQLRFINGDFIREQLNNGSMAIKYEKDNLFNTTLITSSSAELQKFLSKYGNDERLYSGGITITLKKI